MADLPEKPRSLGTQRFTPVPDHAPHAGCGHDHHHGPQPGGHHHSTIKNLKFALALNLGFSLIEIGGGFWSGSVAVLANAIHDLSDALAIAIAYGMEKLSNKQSNTRFSYGYRRISLLSALITCVFILVASCLVLTQAIPLLMHPVRPRLEGMASFAALGVIVNGYAALRLAKGGTMNERVVSWHMIEDVLGWATVLVGTLIMMVVDLPIIDPVLCILSALFILFGVARSLKQTLRLFLQATPDGVDFARLRRDIEGVDGVLSIHDAHLWSLDGQSHVMTLHAVVAAGTLIEQLERIKGEIRTTVARQGRIHVTVEMESLGAEHCPELDCVKGH